MRRLTAPTLAQWGCAHQWKEQSSKVLGDKLHRLRYYFCRRCGLRAKTREVPEVPWDEQTLVAQVKILLPEGQLVYLQDHGITELPLYGLNTILAQHGYIIHATKVRNPKRFVACTDKDGQVKRFGLFELRPIHQEAPGGTDRERR
jgi:hypothetical protein